MTLPTRILLLLAGLALACWLGADRADAKTYCIKKPWCAGTDIVHVDDLEEALKTAGSTATEDSIQLGPAVFTTTTGFKYDSGGIAGNHVKISGVDGTVLRTVADTTDSSGPTVLDLRGAGTSGSFVGFLRIRMPVTDEPLGATGLVVRDASAEDVDVETLAGEGKNVAAGVRLLAGGRIRIGEIDLVPGGDGIGIGASGPGTIIDDVEVSGGHAAIHAGPGAAGRVSRAKLDARGASTRGIDCHGCQFEVDDSIVRVDGTDIGINAASSLEDGHVDASHVTIVGVPPNAATAAAATSMNSGTRRCG